MKSINEAELERPIREQQPRAGEWEVKEAQKLAGVKPSRCLPLRNGEQFSRNDSRKGNRTAGG